MCILNKSSGLTRIDPCLREAIKSLNSMGFKTLACCCGHNKYTKTIVYIGKKGLFFELFSGKHIPRKKKFYKKDSYGYYYIPEVIK